MLMRCGWLARRPGTCPEVLAMFPSCAGLGYLLRPERYLQVGFWLGGGWDCALSALAGFSLFSLFSFILHLASPVALFSLWTGDSFLSLSQLRLPRETNFVGGPGKQLSLISLFSDSIFACVLCRAERRER